MADQFLERTENIQKEHKQHLQDRLLFDASMKKKNFVVNFFSIILPTDRLLKNAS